MREGIRGTITVTIGEEHAAPALGPGWTEQAGETHIEPEHLARDPEVALYAAEAAGLLSGLFAARLQRPGMVQRMRVTLEVER
jgi:hypothetical protein